MPECHTCPHNGKHSRNCITCHGPSKTNHHGKSHVAFEAKDKDSSQTYADVHVACDSYRAGRKIEASEACTNFAAFAVAWMHLDRRTQRIFLVILLDHGSQTDVAKRLRMSPQAVNQRIKRALKTFPAFRHLVNENNEVRRDSAAQGGTNGH